MHASVLDVSVSLVDELLSIRSRQFPEAEAFSFWRNGERQERLTYGELDSAARASARRICALGPRPQRILLAHPPGLDFLVDLFGCFYARAIAIPSAPPALRSFERFSLLLEAAKPTAVLTTGEALPSLRRRIAGETSLSEDEVSALPREHDITWQPAHAGGHECALLQFTSGSSSQPHGVVLTHRNILANLRQIQKAFHLWPQARHESVALWLPQFHDMGLIARLECLWAGCSGHLMPPLEFMRRPRRWLELISRTRSTVSGGPDFAYRLCSDTIDAAALEQLDLSTLRVAFTGAEPIRPDTLETFTRTFAGCGLSRTALTPCYGLAEATLMVSCAAPGETIRTEIAREDRSRPVVSCGYPGEDIDVRVVDPRSGRVVQEAVGELWIRGPNVSAGYWGVADEHGQFSAMPDGESGPGFFRTGDLGFLSGGQIYITGRIKELIIVHGRNIYPRDVELVVERALPALPGTRAVAFGVESGDAEGVAILFEAPAEAHFDHSRLQETVCAVAHRVREEFELEPTRVLAVKRGDVVVTTSGKFARHACRRALERGELTVYAEWPPARPPVADAVVNAAGDANAAAVIAGLVTEVLGRPCLDMECSLKDAGGDSLAAARLLARIRDTFGVELQDEALISPSIRSLAETVNRQLIRQVEEMPDEVALAMLCAIEAPGETAVAESWMGTHD